MYTYTSSGAYLPLVLRPILRLDTTKQRDTSATHSIVSPKKMKNILFGVLSRTQIHSNHYVPEPKHMRLQCRHIRFGKMLLSCVLKLLSHVFWSSTQSFCKPAITIDFIVKEEVMYYFYSGRVVYSNVKYFSFLKIHYVFVIETPATAIMMLMIAVLLLPHTPSSLMATATNANAAAVLKMLGDESQDNLHHSFHFHDNGDGAERGNLVRRSVQLSRLSS